MTEHSWQDCEEGDEQLWPLGDVGCQQMVNVDASLKNYKCKVMV